MSWCEFKPFFFLQIKIASFDQSWQTIRQQCQQITVEITTTTAMCSVYCDNNVGNVKRGASSWVDRWWEFFSLEALAYGVEWRLFTLFMDCCRRCRRHHLRHCYVKSQHVCIEVAAKNCLFLSHVCFVLFCRVNIQWKSLPYYKHEDLVLSLFFLLPKTMRTLSICKYVSQIECNEHLSYKLTSRQAGRQAAKESWIIVYFALKLN